MASLAVLFLFIKRQNKKNVHLNLTPKKTISTKKGGYYPAYLKIQFKFIQN